MALVPPMPQRCAPCHAVAGSEENSRLRSLTLPAGRCRGDRPNIPKPLLLSLRRRQQVAVILHAGLRRVRAGDAVRPVKLGNAAADGIAIVEPHRQNRWPRDDVSGAASKTSLTLAQQGERNVRRIRAACGSGTNCRCSAAARRSSASRRRIFCSGPSTLIAGRRKVRFVNGDTPKLP